MVGPDRPRAADLGTLASELSPGACVLLVASFDAIADCTRCLHPDRTATDFLSVSVVDASSASPDAVLDRARTADAARLATVFVGDGAPEAATHVRRRQDQLETTIRAESVPNPADLTSVGIAVSDVLGRWGEGAGAVGACVHSLPAVLAHVETDRAFRFFHILTGRFRSCDAVAHVHADPTALDARTIATFAQLFDAAIRETADGWELRRA